MDISLLTRSLDDLVGCPKREKKNKVCKLLNIMGHPRIRLILNHNSELRNNDEKSKLFTWNSLLSSLLNVLMDELRSLTRGNQGEAKQSAELSAYFKLLNICAIHGSHGNGAVNINDLVKCFLHTMRDNDLSCAQQSFLSLIQLFFRHGSSYSLSLTEKCCDDVIFWCCSDLKTACTYSSAYLLSLTLLRASSSCVLPLNHVFETLLEFLKRDFRSFSGQPSSTHFNNLGWVIHLIRWLLAEHYVTAWDWHQVLVIVDAVLPTLLVYLVEQRTVFSKLPLPENVDPDRSASFPSKQYQPGYSQLLHNVWSVERTFCENTLVPLLSSVLAKSGGDPDDVNASYSYSGAYGVPLNLFHGSSYFIVEPAPALCRFPCSDSSMLAMEDVDTFEELFCLLRWLLVFAHQHSGSTLNVTLSQGSVITWLRYLFQKWNSIADRISFQNDTTCWKQVRSMRNFFGVFAALLLAIQDAVLLSDPTEAKSVKELLVELICTVSSGPDDALKTKRQRVEDEIPVSDDAVWSHLFRLIDTANHVTVLSTLQTVEIIDYICETLSNHPLLFRLKEAIADSDSLRVLIQLFFLWLQLSHLRSHLCSSEDHAIIRPQLPVQSIKTVLSGLILDLLKTERAPSDSLASKQRIRMLDEQHRVECGESTKRDELALYGLEALLDCLPVQTTDTWLSVAHFEQLVERATVELSRRPLISDLPLPKTRSTPALQRINDACNSRRFGDDDFDDCRSVASDQLEELPEEVDEDNLLKRAHSRRTISLRLFSVLFYFALRIRSCSMLDSLQASLTQLFCNSPCHTVESMEWLCCLVSTTTHAVSQVVRCHLQPFSPDVPFEGLVASFLSCLVDAVREALKARVARVGCISHVCQLIRAAVQLIYCLICAVWSIVAKRGVRLIRGFPLVPADCLQAWMQLHAAGVLDTTISPDHLLSVVLQPYSTPAVLLQFLQFLEKLNDKCRSIVWTRKHSPTLRTLLNSLLHSLKNNQVALQQIVWPGRNSYKFTDLDVTVYVYRLIHSLLVQLSVISPSYAVNSTKKPEGHVLSLRPEVICLIKSCVQLADLHSFTREAQCEEVFQVLLELSPGRDLTVFEQHIRPYLLPLVLSTGFQGTSDGPNLESHLKTISLEVLRTG
ncbi:hypothetical protein AHF37_06651 [Paragonimus kellicotti]|nr:hypothetical protein AHF37_06651 [Paragonimus kellicotti]